LLEDLFLDGLADMYYCEQQLQEALPRMAKAATHHDLHGELEMHLTETERHVEKCERIFEILGAKATSKRCQAILGLIDEAEDLISEHDKSPTINAALILAAQKVEHYEIASYGTLREWAKHLQCEDAANILDEILADEKAADVKLTKLAAQECNAAARTGGGMQMAA